jgi:hypothetical protein
MIHGYRISYHDIITCYRSSKDEVYSLIDYESTIYNINPTEFDVETVMIEIPSDASKQMNWSLGKTMDYFNKELDKIISFMEELKGLDIMCPEILYKSLNENNTAMSITLSYFFIRNLDISKDTLNLLEKRLINYYNTRFRQEMNDRTINELCIEYYPYFDRVNTLMNFLKGYF